MKNIKYIKYIKYYISNVFYKSSLKYELFQNYKILTINLYLTNLSHKFYICIKKYIYISQ